MKFSCFRPVRPARQTWVLSYTSVSEEWGVLRLFTLTFLSDGCLYCWQLRSLIKLDCCNRYTSLRWLLGGVKVEKRSLLLPFFLSPQLSLTFSIKCITSVRFLVENWAGTGFMLEFQVARALLYSGESLLIKEEGWSPRVASSCSRTSSLVMDFQRLAV